MERSELSQQMAEMTERLRGLQTLQGQIVETVRQAQEVMIFAGNPDVVALDDELDILYRGQM